MAKRISITFPCGNTASNLGALPSGSGLEHVDYLLAPNSLRVIEPFFNIVY